MIRFFQFGRYTAPGATRLVIFGKDLPWSGFYAKSFWGKSWSTKTQTERWPTFVLQWICLTRQYSALLGEVGVAGVYCYPCIFIDILENIKLKQIRRVSHTWRAVSGVRQCPAWNSWQDLEGLLILSLPLIYCARHAPHGPHRGSNFLSTSLIFRSTFCTMHCSLLR